MGRCVASQFIGIVLQYVGPNNHMLYPVHVWQCSRLADKVGVCARNAAAFLHLIAALNAICAGGSVAVVHALVWRLTQDWKSSLLAALVYALSWALLVQATTSAEPVIGLFKNQRFSCLNDALIVTKLIGPRDKVVSDFDPVSSRWMALYDKDQLVMIGELHQ